MPGEVVPEMLQKIGTRKYYSVPLQCTVHVKSPSSGSAYLM